MSRKLILYLAILFSLLIISFAAVGIYRLKSIIVTPRAPMATLISPTPIPSPDPDREFSILLLGYGGAGHDGGTLTDSIILADIHPRQKSVSLISIPRDLWVELPTGSSIPFFSKLNTAFPVGNDDQKYPQKPIEFTGPSGGGQMAKSLVAHITDKPVDYFIALDFAGFIKIIDQLGGIDIKFSRQFEDKFYPIDVGTTDTCGKSPGEITALSATMSGDKLDQQFPCRYEDLTFGVGTTHLNGITALKYARSRHSEYDGGDFNRSNRQRKVILAVKQKVVSLSFFSKIIPILNTLSAHVRTDIPLSKIEELIFRGPEFSQYQINSISLNDKNVLLQSFQNKQSVLIPTGGVGNYHEIQQYILDQQSSAQ